MIASLYITNGNNTFRIETFEDEKISVTSSIQNVNDISKVFTDYSQSFTVPASDNNNKIFRHWYENTLNNGFDQRLNLNGYIEIDTAIFKTGRWRLEGASVKNGKPESYKITFFGVLKSLTDLFGEDKLIDIDELNAYTFAYSGEDVKTRIQTTNDLDVLFPLISSLRLWNYGGGIEDISVSGGNINFKELFPAIKAPRIFDAIEAKYGVNFTGSFLSQSRFTQAYLWLKNTDVIKAFSILQKGNLETITGSGGLLILDAAQNKWVYNYFESDNFIDHLHSVMISFNSSTNYVIKVYQNDVEFLSFVGEGTSTEIALPAQELGEYYVEIQTDAAVTYDIEVYTSYTEVDPSLPTTTFEMTILGSATIAIDLGIASLAPDIKVSDYFSGILKAFNLTAISKDGINFELQQIEEWYLDGEIKDFTEYAEPTFEVDKVKNYNNINFEYQESNSILNFQYFEANQLEHGNLTFELGNDGGDYNIKLPFESLVFTKFTNTDLQVAFAVNKDLKPYIPKPVILYKYENKATSFYFNNGVTTSEITAYNVFGQDVSYLSENHTLNFGVQLSSYLLQPINNTLFRNYYLDYLKNLYDIKSRMIKIKMRLPFLEIVNLELNDRIIIREKRYIINQYTTDLQTFETNFEIIQDLRKLPVNEAPPEVVNCVLSEWSAYSECVNNETTRTRTVITPASGGGLACGVLSETEACLNPVDCVLSEWSEYSTCDGQSTQTRTRTVITQPSDGGAACGALSETRNCPPVDCVLSEWSEWSTCSNNEQNATRTVITPASNGGTCQALIKYRDCIPNQDCVLSEWSAYSSCDGQSTQTRTRTVITPQSGNGAACGELSETRDCPVVVQCFNIRVTSTTQNRGITFTYIDCDGISREITTGGSQLGLLVCAQDGSISITDGDGTLSYEGSCT